MHKCFLHPNVQVGNAKAPLDYLPHEVGCICSAHLCEGHLIQIPITASYCNYILFVPPRMHLFTRNYTFNLFDKSLITNSKLACNLDMWITSVRWTLLFMPIVSIPTIMNLFWWVWLHYHHPNAHCLKKLPCKCQMLPYAKLCVLWLRNSGATKHITSQNT